MNKEIKEICIKCELEFHKRGKGCAFRSLGNEYCDLIEDFNKFITNYQNQVEKLTQENNDLEERVIHQDNLIKQLRGNCKDLGKKNENQREELNRLLKQREKFKTKHCYLKERVGYLERSNNRKEETIIELRKEQELDKYKSVIDKAIDLVEKEISNYGSDKHLDKLLEILRSKK